MKTEIKEFIKEQHAEACGEWKVKIEEKFPELFKSQLEIGKWYKLKEKDYDYLICITEIKESRTYNEVHHYGFDKERWIKNDYWANSEMEKALIPATKKEVETALIAEAKRRGIDNDTNIICAYINKANNNKTAPCLAINLEGTSFWGKKGAIFHNGKWATIIEEEKPEFKVGDVVVIVKRWASFGKGEKHKVTRISEAFNQKYVYIGQNANNTVDAFRHATEKEKQIYRLQELEKEIQEIKLKL